MSDPVSIVLAGIGGYGETYLSALLDEHVDGRCRLTAVVDPAPERCERLSELRATGIPILASLEDFYTSGRADLAVISSPIQFHCAQTCLALAHGSHVLCEKPAAATVQDVDRMIEARDLAGKWVAVGYQWSFTDPIQALKRDIQAGLYGEPRRLKSLCLWPRDETYYARNDWAGRLRDDHGRWVLDSPAGNAMAHDLHNMLYLLGDRTDAGASAVEVVAETYRANKIENYDTAAARVRTDGGAEILFFVSHAVASDLGPVFSFEFSEGVIEYPGDGSPIVARLRSGPVKEYSSPDREPHLQKLWTCLDAATSGAPIPCGLEASRPHLLCTNGIQDSMPETCCFPESMLRRSGDADRRLTWVAGLAEALNECYAKNALPSELGLPWARGGNPVNLRNYSRYPGGCGRRPR